MVNRNGCKVVMGGLLMGTVWLTSRSLRLATSGKSVAFCISFVQSPFLYYKPKAHKEVGRLVETAPLSHSKPKKKPRNPYKNR